MRGTFRSIKAIPATYHQPVHEFVDPISIATALTAFPALLALERVVYLNTGTSILAIAYHAQGEPSFILEISALDIIHGYVAGSTFWFISTVAVAAIVLVLRPLAVALVTTRSFGITIYVNFDLWRRGYWRRVVIGNALAGVLIFSFVFRFFFYPIYGYPADEPSLISYLLMQMGKFVFLISAVSLLFLAPIAIVAIPYGGWLSVYLPLRDALRLKRATGMIPTREAIHTSFLGFASERNRRKYIRWLEANCERPPEGSWPEGRPPNVGNGKASVELAKLEERWLGLDR